MKKKLFILLISYFLIFIGHLYALEDITLKKQKWTFEGLFGRLLFKLFIIDSLKYTYECYKSSCNSIDASI